MDERIDWHIKDSGEMWAAARDRADSPVLVKLEEGSRGEVYELTLLKGEGHPFWRINKRFLTEEEHAAYRAFRATGTYHLGDLIQMTGTYLRVRAYVFNGRRERQWDISVDQVTIKIEAERPFGQRPQVATHFDDNANHYSGTALLFRIGKAE